MGGTNSKASQKKNSDSTTFCHSTLTTSKNYPEPPVIEVMQLLMVIFPLDIGQLIFKEYFSFSVNIQVNHQHSYAFFSTVYPALDLVTATNHLSWGNLTALRAILEKNSNPLLLTTKIDAKDHRGTDTIPPGTLFENAIYLGDVFFEDDKKETVTNMLKHYIIKRCGSAEFIKQQTQARQVIQQLKETKKTTEVADSKILTESWESIKSIGNLKIDQTNPYPQHPICRDAVNRLSVQLANPGNEKVLSSAHHLAHRDYSEFGGYSSFKNEFVFSQIIGLIQFMRFSICDLQMLQNGLFFIKNNRTPIRRDVSVTLGIKKPETSRIHQRFCNRSLGVNCYIGSSGTQHVAIIAPLLLFEDFVSRRNQKIEEILKPDLSLETNPETLSLKK